MKAVCISACEVDGVGIVTPGEEVELPDALAGDKRINIHFVVDRATIKDPNAALPDIDKENAARRKRFEESLQDESNWMKALNVVIDSGREVNEEILDKDADKDKKIKKLVDLWIEDFGYVFPSDPNEDEEDGDDPKGKKNKNRNKNRNRNPDADGPKGPKGTPGDRGKPADEAQPGEGEGDDAGNKDGQEDDLFGGQK